MNQEGDARWRKDYVELFLSTKPHLAESDKYLPGDYQIQLLPGDDNSEPSIYVLETKSINKKSEKKVVDSVVVAKKRMIDIDSMSGFGYTLEAKISLKNFPELTSENMHVVFNLAVGDRDGTTYKKCFVAGTDKSHATMEDFYYGFIYEFTPVYLVDNFDLGEGAKNCLIPEDMLPENMKGKNVRIWDMDLATKKEREARESICLDGIWAEQTFTTKPESLNNIEWNYILSPIGSWNFREAWCHPLYKDSNGKLSCVSGAESYNLFRKQVYRALYRTFSIPLSWRGKSVFLSIGNRGTVVSLNLYINKIMVSSQNEDALTHVDITKYLQWDKPNTITILAHSTALKKFAGEYPMSLGDIWLHKGVDKGFISSVFIKTFVPENIIEFDVALLKGFSKTSSLDIILSDNLTGKIAKQLNKKVNTNLIGENTVRIKAELGDLKRWSPEHPNLYTAQFILKDSAGEIIDEFVERFGVRTTRIKGKHVLLNDKPVHIRGSHLAANNRQTYEYFKTMKNKGLNTYFLFGENAPEHILNWFDELGIFIIPHAGGSHVGAAFGKINNSIERKRWIEKVRNHPCILMYLGNITTAGNESGWAYWNFNTIGTHYFPDKSKNNKAIRQGNLETIKFLEAADPTRPVFHYCAGSQGAVWSVMNHADFGMPIQECAGGAESWASTKNPSPFIMAESWPMPTGINLDMHRGGYSKVRTWEKYDGRDAADYCLIAEELSQYIGDEAYLLTEPVRTNKIHNVHVAKISEMWDRAKTKIWTKSGNWLYGYKNPADIALKAIAVREHARSDRGFGLTGRNYFGAIFPFSLFSQEEDLARKQINLIDDLYKPLATVDNPKTRMTHRHYRDMTLFSMPSDAAGIAEIQSISEPKTKYYNYYLDALSPFLMYIGGGPSKDKFRYKDHNFFSGETVIKHIIISNDTEKDLTCNLCWGLRTNGNMVFEKQLEVKALSCEPLKEVISFTTPNCKERTEYELFLTTEIDSKKYADSFGITVFPCVNMASEKTVCLFDQKGYTQKLCRSLGLKTVPFLSLESLQNDAVLLIGRDSLNAFLKICQPNEFREKVKSGLRVLIMEQGEESVLNPLQKEIRLRHQFIKDAAHPVLHNLKDKYFSQWRGEATLTEARPVWDAATEYASMLVPQMFGKWGAEGIVSTLPLERPQYGNVRTLLSGGFDQEWSALMEYDGGKGSMLVSQLDICGRSVEDPVAVYLFRSMITYLQNKKHNNYGSLAFIHDDRLEKILKRFNPLVTQEPSKANLLVVAGNKNDVEQKKEWLDKQVTVEGKTMLVLLSKSSDDLGWLNSDLKISSSKERTSWYYKHIVTAEEKRIPFLEGIGSDDLYFKFRREEIPLITGVPDGGKIFYSGLGAYFPVGKGKVVILQLDPQQHEPERSYKKVIRLIDRLLTNLGVKLDDELNFQNNDLELSGRDWKFCIDPGNKGITEKWFAVDYDDTTWSNIKVGKSWESQGITTINSMENTSFNTSYNGVAWYRIEFDVPKYIMGKQLYLEIAAVAGEDTVYINGEEIGKTTLKSSGGVRNITKAFRNYKIPAEVLKDKGNILSVRVYNNAGMGGLSKLPVRIMSSEIPNETFLYPREKTKKTGDPYRFIMW